MEGNNSIIARYIIEKEPNIIMCKHNGMSMITYCFECYENNLIPDSNSLINFLFLFFEQINRNKVYAEVLNYQDSQNELFGFVLLNSNLNSNDKILLFRLIGNLIKPLEINSYDSNSHYSDYSDYSNNSIGNNKTKNITTYPLIIHSMLLNELEITYLLLNVLVTNGYVGKKSKINENYTIFDYYINGLNMGINFIPIIFKYIKDNKEQCNKFEENSKNKISIIPTVQNAIYTILHLIGFTLIFNSTYDFKNLQNLKKSLFGIDLKNNGDKNKYTEITLSSDNNYNQLDTQTCQEDIIDIRNKKESISFIDKNEKKNKNIWVQSLSGSDNLIELNKKKYKSNRLNQVYKINNLKKDNGINGHNIDSSDSTQSDNSNNSKKITKYIGNSINLNDSNNSNYSVNSDLSESDILFEYN